MKKYAYLFPLLIMAVVLLLPELGFCAVEDIMRTIQSRLITTILPLASILSILFAGFSFVMGSPNARTNLILAIGGSIIGFAAPQIMIFIQGLVK